MLQYLLPICNLYFHFVFIFKIMSLTNLKKVRWLNLSNYSLCFIVCCLIIKIRQQFPTSTSFYTHTDTRAHTQCFQLTWHEGGSPLPFTFWIWLLIFSALFIFSQWSTVTCLLSVKFPYMHDSFLGSLLCAIALSVFVSAPHCHWLLHLYNKGITFMIREVSFHLLTPPCTLFFKNVLAILGPLLFSINFVIDLEISNIFIELH